MNWKFMDIAIEEAIKGAKKDEVPIGAVIIKEGKIYAKGYNNRIKSHLVTGHAEAIVINKACKKSKYWKLNDCELYVTLKPCKMCMEIIREAGIKKVYYLLDPLKEKENRYKDEVNYIKTADKIYEKKYEEILQKFFENKRTK